MLNLLGDRWSLIVVPDIMFGSRRRCRELLIQSEEGIASNMLADRLERLFAAGMLSKVDDHVTSRVQFIVSQSLPFSSRHC